MHQVEEEAPGLEGFWIEGSERSYWAKRFTAFNGEDIRH